MKTQENSKYDLVSISLHWLTAILVLVTFTLAPEDFDHIAHDQAGIQRNLSVVLHESLGLMIFFITVIRLFWLLIRPAPPVHAQSATLKKAARLGHALLWMLLLSIPVSAVMMLMSENYPLTLLGGISIHQWPDYLPAGLLSLADWGEVHEALGQSIIWIAGLHAIAALLHHYLLKDRVLKSMLP